MATFDILVLPGDGIGPEVTAEGVRVLEAVGRRFEHVFNLTEDIVGGACIDAHGVALRPETLEAARASDALLFGAVGGPKWDEPHGRKCGPSRVCSRCAPNSTSGPPGR